MKRPCLDAVGVAVFPLVTLAICGCSEGNAGAPEAPDGGTTDSGITLDQLQSDIRSPGSYDLRLQVDGRSRSCRLHIPSAYDFASPRPLVVVLHGGGGSGARMEELTQFNLFAERDNTLVAYPEAYAEPANTGHWADGRGTTWAELNQVDDVRFVQAVMDGIAEHLAIQGTRVYLAGFSNGSILANLVACSLSEKVTAVGLVSGQLARPSWPICAPAEAVGVIYFHGTADTLVPYLGGTTQGPVGGEVISANEEVAFWVAANGADASPSTETIPNGESSDVTTVEHSTYAAPSSSGGRPVHFFRIEGGGHTWPGRSPQLCQDAVCTVSGDIDATELIWTFFRSQQK